MNLWKSLWDDFPNYIPVNVPDGQSGPWSVSTFTVSKADEEHGRMRAAIGYGRGRYVPAGVYKALKRNGETIMSNTPDEIRDCYDFFRAAQGRVLINGLGLGIALDVILHKTTEQGSLAVSEIVVVEKSQDVYNLVAPLFIKNKRIRIVLADALEYRAEGHFDAAWHDLWDNITSDNLPTMHKLHRKYGKKATWQGSWCREECQLAKQRWGY
jgi:hypothetical protein